MEFIASTWWLWLITLLASLCFTVFKQISVIKNTGSAAKKTFDALTEHTEDIEVERELHRGGRAMRVDETFEGYNKERKESWKKEEADFDAVLKPGISLFSSLFSNWKQMLVAGFIVIASGILLVLSIIFNVIN